MDKQILDSWKEIAGYLQRNVRTCQRWEKELGLPVHRLNGSHKASVFAYKSEIDVWLDKQLNGHEITRPKVSFFNTKRSRLIWLAGVAVTLILVVMGVNWRVLPLKPDAPYPYDRLTIGVLGFQNNTGESLHDNLSHTLADHMIHHLSQAQRLTILKSQRLMGILAQLDLPGSGRYSLKEIKTIADSGGLSYVIDSGFQKSDSSWRLDARLIDVRSLQEIGVAHVDGPRESLYSSTERLAEKLMEPFDLYPQDFLDGDDSNTPSRYSTSEVYSYYMEGRYWDNRYVLTRSMEDFERSRKGFESALALDPNYPFAYCGLGDLYEHRFVAEDDLESREAMLRCYQQAYNLNPDLAETNAGMGWVGYYRQDLDMAYSHFVRAANMDPENADINTQFGSFYRSIGLYEEAVKCYDIAVDNDYLSPTAHQLRAVCYMLLGEFDRAADALRRILPINPDDWYLRLNYARQLILLRKYAEAEDQLDLAQEKHPDLPELRFFRAWLAAARGQDQTAWDVFEGADIYKYSYLLTHMATLLGRDDLAIQIIASGVERGHEEIQTYLFGYLFLKNNPYLKDLQRDIRFQEILSKQKFLHETRIAKYGIS